MEFEAEDGLSKYDEFYMGEGVGYREKRVLNWGQVVGFDSMISGKPRNSLAFCETNLQLASLTISDIQDAQIKLEEHNHRKLL